MNTLNNIMIVMQEKNIKPKDVTAHLNLNPVAFSEWKSGKSKSYRKYLPQIAELLGVSVERLVGAENKEPDEHRKAMLDYFHSLSTEDLEKAHAVAKLITDKKEAPPKKDDA